MRLKPNKLSLACALALTTVFTGAAQAQLEEIIVTATKRSESVQDVGLSVQAFDKDSLQQGGITDVSRLELLVSGVNYAFVGNDAKFNVRGANSSNTFGDNASIVGAFVDGVYKPRASQQTRAFFDVERIEFLKGPQGTLYGRNTFAGALNLYTVAPSLEDGISGNAELSLEKFDRTKVKAAINLPVSDEFAVRLAVSSDKSDGYITNLAGPDIGAQDDTSFRVSALWRPSDTMEWTLRYQNSREDGREAGLFGYTFLCRNETPNGLTDPFGSVQNCANPVRGSGGIPSATDFDPAYTISQDYAPEVDLAEDSITLEGKFDLGSVSLKSITNYTDFENLFGFDFDFSPTPNSVGGFDETLESFSQELQLSSNSDGALKWTGGLYYSKDETFTSFSIFQQTQRDDSVRGSTIGPNGESFTILSGTPIVSRDTSIGGFFADSAFIESDTLGAYAEFEYEVSEAMRLTAGIRYSTEDKRLDGGGSNFTGDTNGDGQVDRVVNTTVAGGASPAIVPAFSRDVFSINRNASDAVIVEEDYSNTTYRLGFEYDLGSDALVYGTYSTGFLSGALSTNGATDEQESSVFEVGYKSYLLDNTLKLNIAAHITDYDNLLTQLQIPVGGIIQSVADNGGEIEAKGVEVEMVYVPNDALTLSANASFLDSEYGVFGVNNPYQLFGGQVVPFIDQEGNTTPWSPDVTLSLGASYRIDMGDKGSVTPYLQVYYSDEYGTSNIIGNDPNQIQDSFTKTDFRVTWENVDGKYSVEAFVENIEDEAVLARGNNNSDDLVQTGFLFPRNAGIRLRANF